MTNADGRTERPRAKRKRAYRRIPVWIDRIAQGHPRLRTALRWTLLLSAACHLTIVPMMPDGGALSVDAERYRGEYIDKVQATHDSRILEKPMRKKIVMRVPLADPQAHATDVLTKEFTSDIKRVIKGVAQADISDELTQRLAEKFEDQLKEAGRKIAEQELTAEEIRILQDGIRDDFEKETFKVLREIRIRDQESTAKLTTTEWYEKKVAATIFPNMYHVLTKERLWDTWFAGKFDGWGPALNFSDIRSNGHLGKKLGLLSALAKRHSGQSAGEQDAEALVRGLRRIFDGEIGSRGTYPKPSWRAVLHGGQDHHKKGERRFVTHLTSGIVAEFHPHREDQAKPIVTAVDGLWKDVLTLADVYAKEAQEGAEPEQLKTMRDRLLGKVTEITRSARKLLVHGNIRKPESRHNINALVRSQVLRSSLRDELYTEWVDNLTRELRPLIRKFAKSQFKRRIIIHNKSVEEALKDFSEEIVPLLRRDLKKMVPKKKFASWVFSASYPFRNYTSSVTGDTYNCPRPEDAKKDDAALDAVLKAHPERKAYTEKRRERIRQHFRDAVRNVREALMSKVFTGRLLYVRMDTYVLGVSTNDPVEDRLIARKKAKEGRGQDYARLVDGVPDPSAAMYSLEFGGQRAAGVSLEPVMATLTPGFLTRSHSARVMRASKHAFPPPPAKRGFDALQAEVKPPFKSPRFEAIPFVTKFPNLNGDLSEWARIRPLKLRPGRGQKPIKIYAAWNYLGFYFAYEVRMPMERYYRAEYDRRRGGDPCRGDYLRLLFDTLDARGDIRGESHTQEFIVLPRGTDLDPDFVGLENLFVSKQEAQSRQWRKPRGILKPYPAQPPQAPDGTAPYRITRARTTGKLSEQGYVVEVFLPRKVFRTPVFAPGWYIGFDCQVAWGFQGKRGGKSQTWASGKNISTCPKGWGDLLLLGTDAQVFVQEASAAGTPASGIVPGHSYLLTVVDPDRNVSLTDRDTVLVSVEVAGRDRDAMVCVLKETKKNSGVFRGYIDTQPGTGHTVHRVLEVLAGDEVRLGYLDFANSKGERNVKATVRLPVLSALMASVRRGE